MIVLSILFVISIVGIIVTSKNAKQGKLMRLKFRHIQGIPNLMDGEIVIISSDKDSINIDNRFHIPMGKIKNKTVTNAKMLTEKQKSVVQRGLVGVVVAGPLGAVIGGISGVGTKKGIEKVNFLTIEYVDENEVERKAMFAFEDSISSLKYLNMFAGSQGQVEVKG